MGNPITSTRPLHIQASRLLLHLELDNFNSAQVPSHTCSHTHTLRHIATCKFLLITSWLPNCVLTRSRPPLCFECTANCCSHQSHQRLTYSRPQREKQLLPAPNSEYLSLYCSINVFLPHPFCFFLCAFRATLSLPFSSLVHCSGKRICSTLFIFCHVCVVTKGSYLLASSSPWTLLLIYCCLFFQCMSILDLDILWLWPHSMFLTLWVYISVSLQMLQSPVWYLHCIHVINYVHVNSMLTPSSLPLPRLPGSKPRSHHPPLSYLPPQILKTPL